MGSVRQNDHDDYLAQVTHDGMALKDVPEEYRDEELCLAAVQQNGLALEFVPNAMRKQQNIIEAAINNNPFALRYVSDNDADNYIDIAILALQQDPHTLSIIHPAYLYLISGVNYGDPLRHAVAKDGMLLEHIPYITRLGENMAYSSICRVAIKENAEAITHIKAEELGMKRYIGICELAILENPRAYDHLPEQYQHCYPLIEAALKGQQSYNAKITDKKNHYRLPPDKCKLILSQSGEHLKYIDPDLYGDDYKALAIQAVRSDMRAILYVDINNPIYHDVLMAAFRSNEDALRIAPQILNNEDLPDVYYDEAVKYQGNALKWIPLEKRTLDRCLAAVRLDGCALQHVPQELVKTVIEILTPAAILATNFDAIYNLRFNEETNEAVDVFLKQIKHIVVTAVTEYEKDHEVKDMYLVYANHEKRKGQTIRVTESHLHDLLNRLNKNEGIKEVNLVFLGHANEDSTTLANVSCDQMAKIAAQHTFIKRITLLGCNTAKVEPLDQELPISEKRSEWNKREEGKLATFALFNNTPDDTVIKKMFSGANKNVSIAYALVQQRDPDSNKAVYILFKYEKNDSGEPIERARKTLSVEEYTLLTQQLNRKRDFKFRNKSMPGHVDYLKDSKHPLTLDDKSFIDHAVLLGVDRFSRDDPQYKDDKEHHPFLASTKLTDEQRDLMQSSLMTLVVEEIMNRKDIKQSITVKGYTKAVHVDTEKKQMVVSRTHAYISQYMWPGYMFSEKNINRKAVESERRKLDKDKDKEETTFKSVKTTIKPQGGKSTSS